MVIYVVQPIIYAPRISSNRVIRVCFAKIMLNKGAESIRAIRHGLRTLKRKLWKSAFSEGVRHFERQFQVDGDVARNRSMDRWIGEWCDYNFAAGRFHTKKLYSRLFSRQNGFYWHKQRYRVFVPPFGGLRGNIHGSSMARWKARGRLPISANWTFFASYHGWGTMSRYWSKVRCLKGGWSLWTPILGGKGRPPPTISASES